LTRHSRIFAEMKTGCSIAENPNKPDEVSLIIKRSLDIHTHGLREHVQAYYERVSGMESVILPEMKRLFDVIRNNPKPNVDALKAEYGID